MTPEMNWTNTDIDLVKPICLLNVSKDEEKKEAFSWHTQPLLKLDHQLKGTKFNFLDYQLQFLKKIRKIDLMRIFFDEIYSKALLRNYPTNKIKSNHFDEIWSIHLADIIEYKTSKNKGYRYIFVITDIFSNCFLAILLQKENSQKITNEFSNILTTSK